MICFAIGMATASGTAKPIPTLPPPATPVAPGTVAIAEFTPTSRPSQSTRAPPEFPGLIDASVWMASASTALRSPSPCTGTVRPSALTTPVVTVLESPSGAPSATTGCPTCSVDESPGWMTGSDDAVTFTTAMSARSDRPTRVAGCVDPSLKSTTISAPSAAGAIT